jgi:hypothetical protein
MDRLTLTFKAQSVSFTDDFKMVPPAVDFRAAMPGPAPAVVDHRDCDRIQTFDDIRAWVANVSAAPIARSEVSWSVAQTIHHLAQTIEMSVRGYPLHKSRGFKRTWGATTFSLLKARGSMRSHDLTAPVPGAARFSPSLAVHGACCRLLAALDVFELAQDPLQEHFFYGRLTRDEYIVAHCLHVQAHARAIRLLGA